MHQTSENRQASQRKPLIYFGIFFIIAFLSYGTGATLIDNITSEQHILNAVANDNFSIIFGAMLMALLHTFANIALPVILLPILKPLNQRFTYAYFAACIIATIVLIFGVVFLMLLVPLADAFVNQGSVDTLFFEALASILIKGGKYGYHLGMGLWSIGGLFLCTILYQSKLISRFISVWGFIGYLTLFAGSVSEIFAHNAVVEIISVIPGGLFELVFSILLIFKGFSNPAIDQNSNSSPANLLQAH